MDRQDEVEMWKTIAVALHAGALDHCETFKSTDDAISYLLSYRAQEQTAGARKSSKVTLRGHHDFYYHSNNLPGPLGLSKMFPGNVADPCRLCNFLEIKLTSGAIEYVSLADNPLRAPPQQSKELLKQDLLHLRRLEHLALMHTPYFVMLFLDLVQNKRYVFHRSKEARHSIASYVFKQLKVEEGTLELDDSFTFIQLWWRWQDRRSSRLLNVSIPSCLEVCTENFTWNPRSDLFVTRKPMPLCDFVTTQCLYHNLWQDGTVECADLSPKMKTLTDRELVVTYSLSVLVPKVHMEDVLQSTVRACNVRQALLRIEGLNVDCSSMLEPRLDCLILQDVSNRKALMLHVVTTLDVQWQTLDSWMSTVRGKVLDERLAFNIHKVFLGVIGSLRDICVLDKRPPRSLYGETTTRNPKLAILFFVHSVTGDVLSSLPLVSRPRMSRSSNIHEDETAFRMACADLALCTLYAHVSDDIVIGKMQELRSWWEAISSTKPPGLEEPHVGSRDCSSWRDRASVIADACRFCKSGLADNSTWSKLRPQEAGSRDLSNVDVSHVWLGEGLRTTQTLNNKLLALDCREPLRVDVIEYLREEGASAIQSRQCSHSPTPSVVQLRLLNPETTGPSNWSDLRIDTRSVLEVPRLPPIRSDTCTEALLHLRNLTNEVCDELSIRNSTDHDSCQGELVIDTEINKETSTVPPRTNFDEIDFAIQSMEYSIADTTASVESSYGSRSASNNSVTFHVQKFEEPQFTEEETLERSAIQSRQCSHSPTPSVVQLRLLNRETTGPSNWSDSSIDTRSVLEVPRLQPIHSVTYTEALGHSRDLGDEVCDELSVRNSTDLDTVHGKLVIDTEINKEISNVPPRTNFDEIDSAIQSMEYSIADTTASVETSYGSWSASNNNGNLHVQNYDLSKFTVYDMLFHTYQHRVDRPQLVERISFERGNHDQMLHCPLEQLGVQIPQPGHMTLGEQTTTSDQTRFQEEVNPNAHDVRMIDQEGCDITQTRDLSESMTLGEQTEACGQRRFQEQVHPSALGHQMKPQWVHTAQPSAMEELGQEVHGPEDIVYREMTPHDVEFLRLNTRWRSLGFSDRDLVLNGYTKYSDLEYVMNLIFHTSRLKEVTMKHVTIDPATINPCCGLTAPQWHRLTLPKDVATKNIKREPTVDAGRNWEMGIESSAHYHNTLRNPRRLVFTNRIPCNVLDCKTGPQRYQSVNLSKCPRMGFRHVILSIGEFPTREPTHVRHIAVKSADTLYLGSVCTIQNVFGLLMHRVYAKDVEVLVDILGMHTSLQVHPFVCRTYALQLACTPFLKTSGVGYFVGEKAGERNLGGSLGPMSGTDRSTLAYHVMQCLLRAQILTLKVLGFTLKCIQPARIWTCHTGLRVDFIGCLVDTAHDLSDSDPVVRGGRKGITTICRTLDQLGLFETLPTEVQSTLLSHASHLPCLGTSDPSDAHALYEMYNLCAFTPQEVSVHSDLETILGPGMYDETSLETLGSVLQPYGPFCIQTHNQTFRWNKAIIVEPFVEEPALARMLQMVKRRATYGRVLGTRKRRTKDKDQTQLSSV